MFLFFTLQTQRIQKYFWSELTGTTIKNLSLNSISNTKIISPKYEEQQKIGEFFSKLDRQIELEEKKLALLEEQKKGYMQKIFSQELRFKDENGEEYPEWEKMNLERIAEIKRGLTYKPANITTKENGIRVLRSSNIQNGQLQLNDDDVFVDKEIINIDFVKKSDILVTAANGSSKLIGKHAIIDDNRQMVHGGFMYIIRYKNGSFLNSWMDSKEYLNMLKLVQGGNGSISNLTKDEIGKVLVTLPVENEQTKIAKFAESFNGLIRLSKYKIELLKIKKKEYLNKILI